jgi:hypothetical protein
MKGSSREARLVSVVVLSWAGSWSVTSFSWCVGAVAGSPVMMSASQSVRPSFAASRAV